MRGNLFIACFLFLTLGINIPLHASHIVGGEITYTNLGNGIFRVYVSIYEDCLTGNPSVIQDDNPAFVRIFKGSLTSGNNTDYYPTYQDSLHGFWTDSIPCNLNNPDSNFIVPANFSNQCVNDPPATCVRKKTFVKDYYLPPDPQGYIIVYQRCCRNASIVNLVNPSAFGASYYCLIPSDTVAPQNSSAVFKNYPPQIICINEPLFYDHSAYDPDSDSLSYEFCNTYGGGNDTDSKPIPSPPPFDPVKYLNPFSYQDPMGGYPQVQINPTTGLITGTPNIQGRFVVTVCCNEWRHGILINTVKREFQFVVTNCSKKVVADIPVLSNEPDVYIIDCAGYTVNFLNTSTGGFSWYWNFGEQGATSTAFQPTYTYHDTGLYLVSLVVNKGSTCPDSIARFVKIYPSFKSNFEITGTQCPGSPLAFYEFTQATYQPVNFFEYCFGDGDTAYAPNPTHTYAKGGEYNVKMISANAKGCSDTTLRHLLIDSIDPKAGDDTIIVQGEKIFFNAYGGTKYTWTSANLNYLSNDTIGNPVGTFTDTGHFVYDLHVVSPFGCMGDTSVKIWVVPYAAFFIPSAFTPNGDGKNDIFRPVPIGYRSLNYFRVYDRWGELIFETKTLENGWDGTYNGIKAEIGTYFWEISTLNRFGTTETKKGDVTLIR